jgi:hypothetical protein
VASRALHNEKSKKVEFTSSRGFLQGSGGDDAAALFCPLIMF